VVNLLPVYQGLNGFQYITNNGTYVIFFNFSIIEGKIIKYFIELSKIEKIENKKHTNRIITYLKCKKQFSHEFKLDRTIINNIINKISNSNFDAIPHDPFAFNNIIMGIIKQVEAKEGLKTTRAGFSSTEKNLSSQGCGGNCDGFKSCKSSCPTCASSTLFGEMTCR